MRGCVGMVSRDTSILPTGAPPGRFAEEIPHDNAGDPVFSSDPQICMFPKKALRSPPARSRASKAPAPHAKRIDDKSDHNVRTLDLMRSHLRTLLHRSDTMGMSDRIEARFPLLDEELLSTAINLPFRRSDVLPSLFNDGFVRDQFRPGDREIDFLFESADQRLRMMLEVWGQLFFCQLKSG